MLYSNDGEDNLIDADKVRINERTVSGLKWIAKRTSAAIKSLMLAFGLYEGCEDSADAMHSVAAFSEAAHLSNLRCLTFSPSPSKKGETAPVLVNLLDWLLQQAPRLQALDLHVRTRCLPARNITFQHVRHLVMTAGDFQGSLQVAEQLPALETLYIISSYGSRLDMVNLSGCKQLRQLVLSDFVAQELILDAPGSGSCPALGFVLREPEPFDDFNVMSCTALCGQAALAQQLVICDFVENWEETMLDGFPQLKVLTLKWSKHEPTWSVEDVSDERPIYLSSCMPKPMQDLGTIIITACNMWGVIPGPSQLPNLKVLIIKASGCLVVAFESPLETVLGLDSMYVFGQPLCPSGENMVRLMMASRALRRRGLVLSAAGALHAGPDQDCSCIYLRQKGMRELPIEEMSAKIEQLVQCRCGACFDCLQRAGCIDEC